MALPTAQKKQDPPRCLLVDDDRDLVAMIKESMQDMIVLDTTNDACSALQMVKNTRYDVIICDVVMPHIDGLSLFEEFQSKSIATPFIFLSGSLDEDTCRRAMQLGAYNLISKPFDLNELLDKIHSATQMYRSEAFNADTEDQLVGYIYNQLKTFYYDVDKIMFEIKFHNLPLNLIEQELDKKRSTGKCLLDETNMIRHLKDLAS